MGTIIATCGHKLKEKEKLGKTIAIGSYTRDCHRALEFLCVCHNCYRKYKKANLILSEEEQENWLYSSTQNEMDKQ